MFVRDELWGRNEKSQVGCSHFVETVSVKQREEEFLNEKKERTSNVYTRIEFYIIYVTPSPLTPSINIRPQQFQA